MPRTPGRGSTELKIPIEQLAMASFFMPWEKRYAKRKCIVEGCDHVISDCVIDNANPGIGVELEQYEKDRDKGTMRARSGPVCEHCCTMILDGAGAG